MTHALTRFAAIAPLAALLAACAGTAPAPRPTGNATDRVYLAVGSDAPWVLEITDARLNFITGPDAVPMIIANPGGRPSFNGMRYVTDALTVDVTKAPCDDALSPRRYADTVTVAAAGKNYRGCGGRVLPPADLHGTSWRIAQIAGVDTIKDAPAMLSFSAGMMSGTAGCNRLSASYVADGTRLTAGPIMATRMACAPDRMAQENAVTALLAKPMSIRFLDDGAMLLMAPGGVSMLLAPAR
ncbi:MAG: hypothetical protein RLZZ58_932 [Pseudomonadota bacterium]|jgi:heat shock protein HslJ/uncharacterized membrane protein